jgi:hypothetical protein
MIVFLVVYMLLFVNIIPVEKQISTGEALLSDHLNKFKFEARDIFIFCC